MPPSEDHHTPTSQGYFEWAYEFSTDPFEDLPSGFGYTYLGAMVLFSPIMAPMYWIGRIAASILERKYE